MNLCTALVRGGIAAAVLCWLSMWAVAEPGDAQVYRTVGERDLKMHVFAPEGGDDRGRAAVLLIHGGGWRAGSPNLLFPHAAYFRDRGLVAFVPEYRLAEKRNDAGVPRAVEDVRAALAWIRSNADRLGVDAQRVAILGESAGGHLAAVAALAPGVGEQRPGAAVLWNPITDTVAGDWKLDIDQPGAISPLHLIDEHAPPTLVIHGTKDRVVSPSHGERFARQMSEVGRRCDLVMMPGAGHAFSIPNYGSPRQIAAAVTQTDRFLASLGWLEGPPDVRAIRMHLAEEAFGTRIGDAGHYITGGTLVYLRNPDGRAFSLTFHRYNWPFEGGWNQRKLRVTVRGPSGAAVLDESVQTDEQGVTVEVPAGEAGVYEVDVNESTTLNYWYMESSLSKAVVWTGPGTGVAYRDEPWFMGTPMVPRVWWFWVPEGTKHFTLKAQSCVARSQREDHGLIIRSPRGQPMAALWDQPNPRVEDGEIVAGREPPATQEAHVVVEPGADGRFWSLEIRLGGAHIYSDINLALEGVPPYLAATPSAWFNAKTGEVPRPSLYDDELFMREDIPKDAPREKDYYKYWMPAPAVGDPDGNEIRAVGRLAMWNPEGRDVDLKLRTYVPRGMQAIKRGEAPRPEANVAIESSDGVVEMEASSSLLISDNARITLSEPKVYHVRVEAPEQFYAYSYPAVPTVLVGSEGGEGGWRDFQLNVGSLRHWYFRVPEGCEAFEVKVETLNESEHISLDINAPDRTLARIYGRGDTVTVPVPRGLDGEIWHLSLDVGSATRYRPSDGKARFNMIPITLSLRGIPAYLSPTREQWFNPEAVATKRASDPQAK